ncbi:hypothetical protein LAUMK4_05919 [Mycobacterium persicum]|uniref:Uncharacterized protein n=1 Tax=Mycobacterium persicum TaxID=1487726 RepID=A0AB38V1K0_9MYCO|nr:hypothetical protein LAUMK15_05727 [Mycobacterium persicum]VAZ86737.1 hypothetical protein LAUMK42_05591 [Mycobacterium persicum]VBA33339.1 hypothetical protein LAUMK4_05919 [Mycobacterium persicum]
MAPTAVGGGNDDAAAAAAEGEICLSSGPAPDKASITDCADRAGGDGGTAAFGAGLVIAAACWMWPRSAPCPPSSPAQRTTSVAVCTSCPVKRVTWLLRSTAIAWAVACRAYHPIEPGAYIASVTDQSSPTANPD